MKDVKATREDVKALAVLAEHLNSRPCPATEEGPAGAIPCTRPRDHKGPHVSPGGWQWDGDT
jgi:hypothetical protein